MTYIMYCKDLGFDCEGVVRAETEGEAMQMVAQHADDVHGIDEITPEMALKVKNVMIVE